MKKGVNIYEPIVYFFDIDGTMIGDIGPQCTEWNILRHFAHGKMSLFKKNLIVQLQKGLLRPGLADFIDFLREKHTNNLIIHVFTASDEKWANFLIPCIENVIGLKFARPIFSRKHCSEHLKKSLIMTIPHLKITSNVDLKNSMLLIDNSRVLVKGEESRGIYCPSYNYTDVCDICRLVPEEVMVKEYGNIALILQANGFFPNSSVDSLTYDQFKQLYFKMLYSYLNILESKQINTPDDFWYLLIKSMRSHSSIKDTNIKDSVIKSINNAISKNSEF